MRQSGSAASKLALSAPTLTATEHELLAVDRQREECYQSREALLAAIMSQVQQQLAIVGRDPNECFVTLVPPPDTAPPPTTPGDRPLSRRASLVVGGRRGSTTTGGVSDVAVSFLRRLSRRPSMALDTESAAVSGLPGTEPATQPAGGAASRQPYNPFAVTLPSGGVPLCVAADVLRQAETLLLLLLTKDDDAIPVNRGVFRLLLIGLAAGPSVDIASMLAQVDVVRQSKATSSAVLRLRNLSSQTWDGSEDASASPSTRDEGGGRPGTPWWMVAAQRGQSYFLDAVLTALAADRQRRRIVDIVTPKGVLELVQACMSHREHRIQLVSVIMKHGAGLRLHDKRVELEKACWQPFLETICNANSLNFGEDRYGRGGLIHFLVQAGSAIVRVNANCVGLNVGGTVSLARRGSVVLGNASGGPSGAPGGGGGGQLVAADPKATTTTSTPLVAPLKTHHTLLSLAIAIGDVEVVRLLSLRQLVSVETVNRRHPLNGITPLVSAMLHGNKDSAEALIRNPAVDLDCTVGGKTPADIGLREDVDSEIMMLLAQEMKRRKRASEDSGEPKRRAKAAVSWEGLKGQVLGGALRPGAPKDIAPAEKAAVPLDGFEAFRTPPTKPLVPKAPPPAATMGLPSDDSAAALRGRPGSAGPAKPLVLELSSDEDTSDSSLDPDDEFSISVRATSPTPSAKLQGVLRTLREDIVVDVGERLAQAAADASPGRLRGASSGGNTAHKFAEAAMRIEVLLHVALGTISRANGTAGGATRRAPIDALLSPKRSTAMPPAPPPSSLPAVYCPNATDSANIAGILEAIVAGTTRLGKRIELPRAAPADEEDHSPTLVSTPHDDGHGGLPYYQPAVVFLRACLFEARSPHFDPNRIALERRFLLRAMRYPCALEVAAVLLEQLGSATSPLGVASLTHPVPPPPSELPYSVQCFVELLRAVRQRRVEFGALKLLLMMLLPSNGGGEDGRERVWWQPDAERIGPCLQALVSALCGMTSTGGGEADDGSASPPAKGGGAGGRLTHRLRASVHSGGELSNRLACVDCIAASEFVHVGFEHFPDGMKIEGVSIASVTADVDGTQDLTTQRDADAQVWAAMRVPLDLNSAMHYPSVGFDGFAMLTPLSRAARAGNLAVVQHLFYRGYIGDVNRADVDGWTALMHASAGGHVPTVQFLLRQADIDVSMTTEGSVGGPAAVSALTVSANPAVAALLGGAAAEDSESSPTEDEPSASPRAAPPCEPPRRDEDTDVLHMGTPSPPQRTFLVDGVVPAPPSMAKNQGSSSPRPQRR